MHNGEEGGMMTRISRSERETEQMGEALAKRLKPGAVVALFGDLGMGKTAFVRGMAAALGSSERVTSPTFTLVNEYPGKLRLYHFDMYRLSGPEELFDIGWEDYLDAGGICAVEWSENVASALPPESVRVVIERLDDSSRRITIEGWEEI